MTIDFQATERILSFDQTPLFWRKHLPESPKAHVIIVHGFSEHGGRYAHVAEYLAGKGYGVWAMDNRGHGRSAGKRGHVLEYSEYVRDLAVFHELVAEQSGSEKVHLLGHSNGGLISLCFALAHPSKLKTLCLSAPLLALSKEVPAIKMWAGRTIAKFAPSFTMANDLVPDELTHDPAMIEAYLADPLIFHELTVGWFQAMEGASEDARSRGAQVDLPLLMQLGGSDPVVSTPAAQRFFETVASRDKEIHTYEGLYHEIYNETERATVMNHLGAWLDRHEG